MYRPRPISLLRSLRLPLQEGRTIQATVSLGCATFPIDAETEEALMAEADAALYRAKRGGRNRVCLAQKEISVSIDGEAD